MSSRVCKHCGGSEVDVDQARGDAVCMTCGSVLEDNIIVSEVQFEQTAAGASNVIGQFVSSEGGGKSMNFGGGFHHGIGKESRLITLQKGNKRIKHVGAQLKLNQHCVDMAYNFFKMAVHKRLTRGRKSNHVIAACMYITCRLESTSHMLLDFADVLQENVYVLGRTYYTLAKEMYINIPVLDPCLYIHRFSHKLEFGDKTHEVSMTALRLVSRMKRDWMAQGRRPSGLCGAALLVAARMHDFNRTIKEIVRVAKIGDQTIRKRLQEFEATPSGQLTIDEFQKIDLEEEADPPCFTEGKKKAELQLLEEQLPQLTEEVLQCQVEIDEELKEHLKKKHKRYGKHMEPQPAEAGESLPSSAEVSAICQAEAADVNKEVETFLQSDLVNDILHDKEILTIKSTLKLPHTDSLNSSLLEDGGEEGRDPDYVKLEREEMSRVLSSQGARSGGGSSSSVVRPALATLGIKDTVEECLSKDTSDKEKPVEDGDGELDLEGLDDDELDSYILSDTAAKRKTIMWLKENAMYLKEQKLKELKRQQEEEEERNKPDHLKKKKRQVRKRKTKVTEHSSAGEAIEKMLQEKKLSSKINYDVLKGLSSTTAPSSSAPDNPAPSTSNAQKKTVTFESVFGSSPVEEAPVKLKSEGKRPLVVKEESDSKRKKTEETKTEEEVAAETEVIVESGPVDYSHEDELDGEDEDYYDDDEPVSAAALLGHTEPDEYEDDEEDYY